MPRRTAAEKTIGENATDVVTLTFKTTQAYHAWLEGLADQLELPITQTIEFALKVLAEQRKYPASPRRWQRKRRAS